MDSTTHQHQPTAANPEPPAPAPAPPAAALQEATGDSEFDNPAVSALAVGDRPSLAGCYEEDDAESCSGAGGGYGVRAASVDGDGREEGYVAVEVDEDEVDSRMAVVPSWWRRTVKDAVDGAGGGGCARQQPKAEGGAAGVAAGDARHAAESNRLFWEACIAHGY